MTNEAKIVIESMRQAFETFADIELPIRERKCTLAYESVMALINGFDEAQYKEENLRKMIDRLCVALDTAKKERDAAIADLNYAGSPDGEFCSICAYRREEDCENASLNTFTAGSGVEQRIARPSMSKRLHGVFRIAAILMERNSHSSIW